MGAGDRRKQDRRQQNLAVAVERRIGERRHGDRRAAKRVMLELWMEEVTGEDVYFRRTGNIGQGGVYFDKAVPHALGTMVTLKFTLPGDKEMIVARGEVVNTAAPGRGLGMGVKFITVEGDGETRIRDFIRGIG